MGIAVNKYEILDNMPNENEIIHRTSMSESSIPDQKASPQTGSRFRRSFSLNKSLKRYRASFNQLYRQGVKSLDHVEEKCAYLYTLSDRESWQRVWCVSRTPVLEMYSRRDACRPSATINLQQTKAVWLARAGHLGKRYVIGIRADKESHPTFIAMETEDELNDWLTYIKALTDAEVVTETDDNELSKKTKSSEQNGNVLKKDKKRLVSGDDNTLQRTTNEKRQLLLEEVLSNKKLLEQKQKGNRHEQPPERSEETKKAGEDFNKTECVQRLSDGTQDDLVIDKSPECESSSEWKKIILLKRRKVSIELKMESLHRVLHSTRPKEQKKCKSKVLWSEVSVGSKAADVSYRVPDASPEVKHWTLQLAALLREHDEIIDEIQRCQHKHKWYNDATPVETDPSFGRSRSLLVCSENVGSETNISEVNRSTSGGWDGTDVSKDKTLKTQSGTKHNRLERIGKRFSNLPSLMTKKGLLRRGFSVRYDSEGGRNTSNRQKQTSRLFKKSISIDESYVSTLSYPWPGEKKDGVDHMIGRRHDPLRATHSSEEYRSQDSTPSGVTSDINLTNQKLDTAELDMTSSEAFYDLTKTLGDVLVFPQNVDRSRDSDRNESEVASGDLKTDQPQTSMADPDTAASFLEGSFDTDSGRGSPMSPEVTEVKASHSQTTNEKHEGRIREETVSKIEAFEGLIREKLGILPNSS